MFQPLLRFAHPAPRCFGRLGGLPERRRKYAFTLGGGGEGAFLYINKVL